MSLLTAAEIIRIPDDILFRPTDMLVEMTVSASTGTYTPEQVAADLRKQTQRTN